MDEISIEDQVGIINYGTKLSIYGSTQLLVVTGGEIVKIVNEIQNYCFFKIYSCRNKKLQWSTRIYYHDQNVIKRIPRNLCLLLIGIPDQSKRLMISKHNDYKHFLLQLKLKDLVQINGALLNLDQHLVCVVKYIGLVPQIGPGIYLGVELCEGSIILNFKHNITLAKKLWNCRNNNGYIINCGGLFTRSRIIDQSLAQRLKLETNRNISLPDKIPSERIEQVQQYSITTATQTDSPNFPQSNYIDSKTIRNRFENVNKPLLDYMNHTNTNEEHRRKIMQPEYVEQMYMTMNQRGLEIRRLRQSNKGTSRKWYIILLICICLIGVVIFKLYQKRLEEIERERVELEKNNKWHLGLFVAGIILVCWIVNRYFWLCIGITTFVLAIYFNIYFFLA